MSVATFRFSVGTQYCIAKIKFEGGNPSDLISKFVSSENVPIYLEDPLQWASSTLLTQAKEESNEQAEAGLVFRPNFLPICRPFFASLFVWCK